ncbi:hypothetical protein Pcinc_015203 [Petrolisthes cinctipes]|uniref:Pyridine nucleotide-disulfide oxidoreductase domain-containing protein 1 n=1 Tax=Petrolisthes cinctipes TaxID=88211 RepID=A0AAE1FUX4_PETCI|nr:hypothetical protein Pcinc_015203 [Petrolisthes cinctipes]
MQYTRTKEYREIDFFLILFAEVEDLKEGHQLMMARVEPNIEEFTYVIVGGGIAGVTCAEHLHILHPEERTLVITASPMIKTVTNILPVTKILESFDVEERPARQLQDTYPNLTVVKDTVIGLDSAKQHVLTSSGKCFSFQKLCLCNGATPKIIAPNSPHVVWIRDTESAQQFQARIQNAKRILIVGNGGIATEMVYEVRGVEIIWAIKDRHMTAHFIDPGAAEFLRSELNQEKTPTSAPTKRTKFTVDNTQSTQEHQLGGALGPDWHADLELRGKAQRTVTLETEVEVARVMEPAEFNKEGKTLTLLHDNEEEWPVYAELTNGKVYGCNFIVSAIGVTPNTSEFTKGNNLELGEDGGFLVDDKMRTSVKNVFAAGDVCSPGWKLAKHWFQMRLWTQARHMGMYVAKCMWAEAVGEEVYQDFCFELFVHTTKFFGHKVILLGLFNGQNLSDKYEVLLRVTKGTEYVKCIMEDGRLQGAVLIGDTDLEETFENLILDQLDLSHFGADLLHPGVDIEDFFD